MRILVVRGNPRKDGHTQHITDLVVQGAREAGAACDDIDLCTKKINRCIGCYQCWTVKPGICIHSDDMPDLCERLYAADILLCATPLYNYTMSSTLKTFIERLLPLTKQEIVQNPNGLFRNKVRDPDAWGAKKLAVISACAFKSIDNFKVLDENCKYIAHSMHMTYGGGIFRPESFLLPFSFAKPKTIKRIETALLQCGGKLAKTGIIPETLQQKVCLPLAVDPIHFQKYSAIYWEHVRALGTDGTDLSRVQDAVMRDVRILMREMARSIDPMATAGLHAVLQFAFNDKDLHFCITIHNGACTLEEKKNTSSDLSITTDSITWGQIFTRQLPVKEALATKKISVTGDKNLFIRLDRYFPPPSA